MVRSHAQGARSVGSLLIGALWLLTGCRDGAAIAKNSNGSARWPAVTSSRLIESGTRMRIALGSCITSQTAKIGDAWCGTVTENVMALHENLIPPGSEVRGVIANVVPAMEGSIAMLELSIRGIRINGRDEEILASADPVISGSDCEYQVRAGGSVAGFRDHQMVLPDDTIMSFTVSQTTAVR